MTQDIYKTLGQRVRGYRLKIDWSQEELGERAGLHASYIGQIERGTKKISLLTLQKLALALKVSMSSLLNEGTVKYKSSRWEHKIASVVRDKPTKQQEYVYKFAKDLTRLIKKVSKR